MPRGGADTSHGLADPSGPLQQTGHHKHELEAFPILANHSITILEFSLRIFAMRI